MRRLLAITLLVILVASTGFAQEAPNPFTTSRAKPSAVYANGPASFLSPLLFGILMPIQRTLNQKLSSLTRSVQSSRSAGGILFIILLSLVYGLFHAAAPGHGKTIVSSYFLANDVKLRHAFIAGNFIAAVHALSALMVVFVLYFLVRGVFSTGVEEANRYIQLVSFAVITVLGAVMLVRRARGMGHHHHHGEAKLPTGPVSAKGLLRIAVPAGLIPCPAAIAVVLFALSLQLLGLSILSVVSMSLGMGVTISIAGAMAILVKSGTIKAFAGGHEERVTVVRRVLEIAGAAILFLLGLILLLVQL